MDYQAFGKKLKKFRQKRDLYQETLGEMADCSASFIGQIENGTGKPSMETFMKLVNALQTTPDQLLLDSVEHPELVYLHDIEKRLHGLSVSQRILFCEAMNDIMTLVEKTTT